MLMKTGLATTARLAPAALAVGLALVASGAPAATQGQPVPECGGAVICARERWNDTGVDVTAGEPVHFRISGTWYDAGEEATFEGYAKPLFAPVAWLRRYPGARWFALIACVERTRHCAPVRADRPFVPVTSGRVYMYANDLWPMYSNNRGQLTVERVIDPR
ncbi:hypothetical protein [Brevundimonas sp.]|uniref:hypothetical protein n=1 Tax=Brevundimonas sp. TaxID=1871086 RepID=UPI003D146657